MQLTQIYISDDRQPMGDLLDSNANIARESLPEFKYAIYGDEEIQKFLSSNFSSEVLDIYESLAPYAYKSDFARYCILYKVGGWYIDVGLRLSGIRVKVPDNISLIAFRDHPYSHTSSSFACANGAIYAKMKHPAIAKAIELIIDNTKKRYYGLTPLCPTGPTLWGRAIAITGIDSSYLFGDFIELTQTHSKANKAMVLPDGSMLGYHKKRGGRDDLKARGARGTNNDNDFRYNKKVYLN